MRAEIKILTISNLILLSFMIMAALFEGVLTTIVYYIGYFAAIAAGFLLYWIEKKSKIFTADFLKFDKHAAAATALMTAPTVAAVMGISFLTSLLISRTVGVVSSVELDGRIWVDIIVHAFIPAVLEETLFRYLPLRVLKGGSRLCTVVVSSIFFACIHMSFLAIPYALFAGAIFMLVDILADSVIPSLVIHFINNVLSILWLYFSENPAFHNSYIIMVVTLALLSLVVIALFGRGEIKRLVALLREAGVCKLSYEPLLFIVPTLVLAVAELV